MTVLSKILSHKKQLSQLWFSFFGLLLGLTASLLAIILITDIKRASEIDSDVFGDNTLVIQKHVSRMTSLGMNSTRFTDDEITNLNDKDFILEVAPFKTANYEVGISENPGDGLPAFYAEMFLQSVPNSFLGNIDTAKWHWQNENDIVPIILPRDFLTLVNYGIGPSKGLPQISEELIKSVRLRLHLIGNGKKGIVLGQVIGFSSKISSVLVPESFIDLSNKTYSNQKISQPNRLFIKTKANSFGEVNDLMTSMNLDISESELSISKISTYLIQMMTLFFVFAVIILGLSIMYFIQYLQTVLYQLNTEVSLLIKLGYQPKMLVKLLQKQFLKILLLIIVISLSLVFIAKFLIINPLFTSLGIETDFSSFFFGMLFVLLLLLGCAALLRSILLRTILKIFKKA